MKTAIDLDPDDFGPYELIDWVLMRRRDYNSIIEYRDRYIAINPDHVRAYTNRGGAYYRKGDYGAAVADAKTAADLGDLPGKEAYEKFRHLAG